LVWRAIWCELQANDKDSQKMRTLKNHVFVNNFQKLQMKQCVAAVRTVCFREGITIDNGTVSGAPTLLVLVLMLMLVLVLMVVLVLVLMLVLV
jgi:hypothetical protein